jgi:hypothetical protein
MLVIERFADPIVSLPPDAFRSESPVQLRSVITGKIGSPVTIRQPQADEWVTQMLRQGDAQVMKKYSQMKLQMKREALGKLNRLANEMTLDEPKHLPENGGFGTVVEQFQ